MVSKQEIEQMNIAFEFHEQYTVARVPLSYCRAEAFALKLVYYLRQYVAEKLNVESNKVLLIAISKNKKVVVCCKDSRSRNWLWNCFGKPSLGDAQFYDDVDPELILNEFKLLFPEG